MNTRTSKKFHGSAELFLNNSLIFMNQSLASTNGNTYWGSWELSCSLLLSKRIIMRIKGSMRYPEYHWAKNSAIKLWINDTCLHFSWFTQTCKLIFYSRSWFIDCHFTWTSPHLSSTITDSVHHLWMCVLICLYLKASLTLPLSSDWLWLILAEPSPGQDSIRCSFSLYSDCTGADWLGTRVSLVKIRLHCPGYFP